MDLNDILLRPPDTYSEDDKKLIRENESKLNDEEKEKFKSWLHPGDDTGEDGDDDDSGDVDIELKDDTKNAATPEKDGLTKEQLDTYLDAKKQEWDKAGVSKEDQKQAKEDIIEFYKSGELPKDWNDAGTRIARKTIDQLMANPESLAKTLAPLILKEAENLTASAKAEMDKKVQSNTAQFDREMESLVKTGKIVVKDKENYKNDPAFKEADKQIAAIAIKYNQPNMLSAYNIWKDIPQDRGGGLDVSSYKMKGQKRAAGMIGSPSGGGGTGRPNMSNKQLHETSLDQLIDAA